MSQVITLFCEGKKNSLDERILHKLHPMKSEVRPIGGKTAFNSFIDGYCSTSLVTSKEYVRAFRDRDFDYTVPGAPVLIQDKHFFISYRTTIENYLLHPKTLYEYVHALSLEKGIRDKLSSVSICEDIFREVSIDIRFYTAARWAHGVTKKNSTENFNFKSDWPYDSGAVPAPIGDSDCRTILSNVIDKAKTKANQLDFGVFEEQYATFISKFDDEFFKNMDNCLIWFNGKDIASMIHRKIGGNSFFQNGQKGDYYDFALGDEYFEKSLSNNEYPDLLQLQEILNGSTPIEPIKITN